MGRVFILWFARKKNLRFLLPPAKSDTYVAFSTVQYSTVQYSITVDGSTDLWRLMLYGFYVVIANSSKNSTGIRDWSLYYWDCFSDVSIIDPGFSRTTGIGWCS
jgi:hypothetical protein